MPQLKYTIDEKAGTLTLLADEEDRAELKELVEDKGTTTLAEAEALEYLIANTELDWIDARDTEDMTDAPLLGIVGSEEQRERKGPYGAVQCGHDEGGDWYQPIVERWGFADYALRSFLTDLIEDGKAVFHNSW